MSASFVEHENSRSHFCLPGMAGRMMAMGQMRRVGWSSGGRGKVQVFQRRGFQGDWHCGHCRLRMWAASMLTVFAVALALPTGVSGQDESQRASGRSESVERGRPREKRRSGEGSNASDAKGSYTVTGTGRPIKYDVYDDRTGKMQPGLGYPIQANGRLRFTDPEDQSRWCDPTEPLHFHKGERIAEVTDPDLAAGLAAERGCLGPLRAEYRSMRRMQQRNPAAMSKLKLILKEGKTLQLEAAIVEKEIETALRQMVVAPADCEIIEGTRYSVNINALSGNLFRYYPLSHIRFLVRLPLKAWGPDWLMDLRVNDQPAQILSVCSVDLDETNEEWILGIEFKPAQRFDRMSDKFQYELTTKCPETERLSQDVTLHPSSCVLVGQRRSYSLTAPKIPGLLFFSKAENSWVQTNEEVGGVTLEGLQGLLEKMEEYRRSCGKFIDKAEREFIPEGAIGENDPQLGLLKQYRAEAGRFVERKKAMTIEAKGEGLLVGTLDYQGPVTSESAELPARIKSPFVEIPDVRVLKDIDVEDGDIVFVELPSGNEKMGQVFKVVPETISRVRNLSESKLISVLVYDPEFELGETPQRSRGSRGDSSVESGMPVSVSVPVYSGDADKARIQKQLKAEFEQRKSQPAPKGPLYPIQFTVKNTSLSPAEKLAYMRRAGTCASAASGRQEDYCELLTRIVLEQHDPETRWVAFQKLVQLKFTTGFSPFIQIALHGRPDVATASLFHLYEKRRVFELFDILTRLKREQAAWRGAERKGPILSLAYQLLRGLIDYPHAQSDALTHLVKRGRLDSDFQRRLENFLFSVIRTEGVNAPASIRGLRGEDRSGQPYFPEHRLKAAVVRAEESGDSYLRQALQRELERRKLKGISSQTKYGYGAKFIETGFLYLRDLDKIDLLARSRENYLHDLRFLNLSPRWTEVFALDPRVLSRLRSERELAGPVPARNGRSPWTIDAAAFGEDITFAAFRQLTKTKRSQWIRELGGKKDYSSLVLLLRDPFIRRRHGGDVLDWLLLSPEARLEVARYYVQCPDNSLLDSIDQRYFAAEVLPDIDTAIRRIEAISMSPGVSAVRLPGRLSGPATIHIYQQLLLCLWDRTTDSEKRFHYLVCWAGLLPSGFELGADLSAIWGPLRERGIPRDQFEAAVRYVRQRRALKYAVNRERAKRAENRKVEIQPGPEEAILRQLVQQVEAGMPPGRPPLALLKDTLQKKLAGSSPRNVAFSLRDAMRLARIRNREFAAGHRDHLQFRDIIGYVSRIALAPLYVLLVVPMIWLAKIAVFLFQALGGRPSYSTRYFEGRLRKAEKLLRSIEAPVSLKREISGWLNVLKADQLNTNMLPRLQERAKRILNVRELVYHVSGAGEEDGPEGGDDSPVHHDPLDPETAIKLAPCLTLMALLTRLTAERIWQEARREKNKSRRVYLFMEWFLQRSIYFSGYRYALNPLANHQIAENYVWRDIPLVESEGHGVVLRGTLNLLNLFIAAVNRFGQLVLSLPMRFLYLFNPISLLGAVVFRRSLRRLVIERGNMLEENLYPDPRTLMQRTRAKLRIGWAHRAAQPDQPGGRFLFSFRRIATRVLPFVVVVIIVAGGFAYLHEVLVGDGWMLSWNIRSTGIFAAFAALFTLTVTMVLHWLPLLMGWIPFAHLRNLNGVRLLRSRARKTLLKTEDRKTLGRVDAENELQMLYIEDALEALRGERESKTPMLHLLVLMVEDPEMVQRYRSLAKSLVSDKTVVLAYPTSEAMDGGGARLSMLKMVDQTYSQIREKYPHLPSHFCETRSCFVPLGSDRDPLIELPVRVADPTGARNGERVPLTPFLLAIANVQSLVRHSFACQEDGTTKKFVGSITAAPERLYVGPHNVDQGGRFRGGITLVGAFERIRTAGEQGALVIMGKRAFIRTSPDQLKYIIRTNQDLNRWLDPENTEKRQLPVAQLVIERFRTPYRYGRHVRTCVRYIDAIQSIKAELLARGPQGENDVSDEEFLNDIAIHYMRHLIVPWFIAYQGGSLESYRNAVLTGDLSVRDRRRVFHNRVLELVELFQEEGQVSRRQLPKVRFANTPSARIYYAKTYDDVKPLWENPRLLFPITLVDQPDSLSHEKASAPHGLRPNAAGGPAKRRKDGTVIRLD